MSTSSETHHDSGSEGSTFSGVLIFLLVAWFVASGFWRFATMPQEDQSSYRVSEVLAAQGFDLSKSHPLALGSSITGADGKMKGDGGLFSGFYLEGSSHPTSAMRLGMQAGESTYIMEVPLNKVRFHLKQATVPSATFVIRDRVIAVADSVHCPFFMSFRKCTVVHPSVQKTGAWTRLNRQSPVSRLQKNLVQVDLTVTLKQYQIYLGRRVPTI